MSLPTKSQTVARHLPLNEGSRVIAPRGWPPSLRPGKASFRAKPWREPADAACFQYTGRDPKAALEALQDLILNVVPGAIIVVDGFVRQRSLVRVANKATIGAVNAAVTLHMLHEVVQVDFEAGDGIFVGRVSE